MGERNQKRSGLGLSDEIKGVLAHVERVVRESEARIQAILQSAADAIITIDAAGLIESFNPAAEQMFGYAVEDVLGRSVSMLMPSPHRERHDDYIANYLAGGESEVIGTKRRVVGLRKGGVTFPMELAVSEVRLGDRLLFTGIVRDISEREEAEKKLTMSRQFLQATLDALPQHIAILDQTGEILEVNAAWRQFAAENMLPLASFGVGDNYLDVCERSASSTCAEAAKVAAGIREVIGGREGHFQLEYPCHGPREQQWFSVHVTRFEGDAGIRAVVAHENITARKRIEVELEAAKEAAELGNRMKDEFLAMLSHELRNPLAPLRHAVSLLHREGLPRATRERVLRILAEQVDHVVHLVDDLLDLTRIKEGRIRIHKEPVDLRDCVRRAIDATEPLVSERGHTFIADAPSGPIVVDGDADRLQQVTANLVNNAAKYTPAGGRIRLEVTDEGSSAVLRVGDNGIGMTAEDLERVFDPFAQAGGSEADSQGGLGLGLTLVRRLVELHAGTIEAHSEGPNQGSEFVVRLPLAARPLVRVDDDSSRKSPHFASPNPPLQILVVDDNAAAADMLTALLEIDGWHAVPAYDGPTALDVARRMCPDVILLDLRMSGMDGFEVVRRLRKDMTTAEIPIIAMSGLGQDRDIARSRAAGFDDHLMKPVDPAHLEEILARIAAARGAPTRGRGAGKLSG